MATVNTSDTTSFQAKVQIDDKSQLAQSKLQSLVAPVTAIVSDLSNPLDQAKCTSATFGATFASRSIDAGDNLGLTIKAGANAALGIIRPSDGFLFKKDEYAPPIAIGKGQAWMSFELDTIFDLALNQIPVGGISGFGVGIEVSTPCKFTTYTLFDNGGGSLATGKECLGIALSNFKILRSSQDIRNQKPGTVYVNDVAGTLKFTGYYSVPMSINNLSLASLNVSNLSLGSLKLPFNYTLTVEPDFDLELKGSVAVTGEYSIRCHRVSDTQLQLGVYKKKQTELAVHFDADAGVEATKGAGDLISSFFSHIAKVDPKAAGLSDADCGQIERALTASVNRSLAVCLNLACSASFADEAAFVYAIDLSQNTADTDAALDAAFKGNWSLLQQLPNAKEQRNVVGETKDRKHVTTVNLLGIFNYGSIDDFVGSCTVLHSPEDGTITVTDKQTASRVSVAAIPYVAAADRLRAVLNEACLATLTYTAASAGGDLNADLKVSQSLLIYKDKWDSKSVHKSLLAGRALQLLNQNDWQNLAPASANPLHVRVAAQAVFDGNAALQLFFSDPAARAPRKLDDLSRLGRNVLSALLDRSNPVDAKRWQILNDDNAWSQMEQQQFPQDSPASYSDWYDVTFWSEAVYKVAPQLKAVLDSIGNLAPGSDPSKNSDFMAKRASLANAIGAVTRNSHAAFEPGWPIAVMCALSNFTATISFQAAWDGQTYVDKKTTPAMAAAATAVPGQP